MPVNHGLDIHPRYNPVVNWSAIPAYELMSVKCTEGRAIIPYTWEYFKEFRKRGFPRRGAYHWVRSDSPMQAQINTVARWWDELGGMQDGEFFQIDWETTSGVPHVNLNQIEEFVELSENLFPGRCIVYGAQWVPYFKEWRNGSGRNYPLWYAYYGSSDATPKKWNADLWQYTSSTTGVPGFAPTTRLDCNQVLNWETIDRISHKHATPPTLPPTSGGDGEPYIYPPWSELTMTPIDYGIAGTDWWWTEMAVTPRGLQWSAPVEGGGDAKTAKIREIFVAVPLPRAPRLKNDGDVVTLMETIGTFGLPPATFATNPTLVSAWAANINPGP
jgi:hypothetical protein